MGRGLTEQQAHAVELTTRATLLDALRAMNIDPADIRLEMVYKDRQGGDVARHFGIQFPPPAVATVTEPGPEDVLLTDATGERPAVEGVDFYIANPSELAAEAAASGKSVAQVAQENAGGGSEGAGVVDDLGWIDPAVSGPIQDI